ncbi:MAG: ATP-dependent 6-phosphofructokinase [Treponema sp.]|nr:ATP-dependent 6-phosphofructokinase [Treponema sp.]MCL2250443.1 ATP-dependent 6-phosphofructokinase [Treponema sp.]
MDYNFIIEELGKPAVHSPIIMSKNLGDKAANYVTENERFVRLSSFIMPGEQPAVERHQVLERAGPREFIYFSPVLVHAGIVSCGGLCPGINDVIRSIVRCLWMRYGVKRITGFQYGYLGMLPESGIDLKPLDPDMTDDIHKIGGTFLGSARGGGKEVEKIADTIQKLNMNMLFVIGGDGTQRGTVEIAEELEKRNYKAAVIGIPKTVDNDFALIDRSFGFNTAVAKAVEVVSAAHVEAKSAINGIGLVKLMGRDSGFIAAHTALASHEVNFVLIPEVPFNLEGYNGFLHHLEERLVSRKHAVIIVAEGAMQDQLITDKKYDAGGNVKMADVGIYMRSRIIKHFEEKDIDISLKYIDPSYAIRSAPANPDDSIYCERLGNAAVHAAMAGKTKLIIGLVNNRFVHLPIRVVISHRNKVNPESSLWRDTIDATNQPPLMVNRFS